MKKTITFLAIALTATFFLQAQEDWIQQTPQTTPPGIGGHQMAFIGDDKVLLFGGFISYPDVFIEQTWVYDLSDNSWTLKSPLTSPAGRYGHSMAYIGDDKVLLFGGIADHLYGEPQNDETWVYDLSDDTWTLLSPSTSPSARRDHAMAFLGSGQVLLFGGDDGLYQGWNDETWVYDLKRNNWTQKSPTNSPSGRFSHAMASMGTGQALLFSGQQDNATWIYSLDADNWVLQNAAPKPLIRGYHSLSYMAGDQVLLYGGFINDGNFPTIRYSDTTWVYNHSNRTWTEQSTTANPVANGDHNLRMASIGANHVLLFDQVYGASNETWLYSATPQPDDPCNMGNSGNHKIRMCHKTNNPNKPWIEICVDENAVDAHLAHGDYLGSCNISTQLVGIEEDEELNMSFMLYPNPAEQTVTLSFHGEKDGSYFILVADVTGKNLLSYQGYLSQGKNLREISLKNMASGMYYLSLILDDKKEVKKLLVK